jgi:hypothetical protein
MSGTLDARAFPKSDQCKHRPANPDTLRRRMIFDATDFRTLFVCRWRNEDVEQNRGWTNGEARAEV